MTENDPFLMVFNIKNDPFFDGFYHQNSNIPLIFDAKNHQKWSKNGHFGPLIGVLGPPQRGGVPPPKGGFLVENPIPILISGDFGFLVQKPGYPPGKPEFKWGIPILIRVCLQKSGGAPGGGGYPPPIGGVPPPMGGVWGCLGHFSSIFGQKTRFCVYYACSVFFWPKMIKIDPPDVQNPAF